jgi:hypothetical protein
MGNLMVVAMGGIIIRARHDQFKQLPDELSAVTRKWTLSCPSWMNFLGRIDVGLNLLLCHFVLPVRSPSRLARGLGAETSERTIVRFVRRAADRAGGPETDSGKPGEGRGGARSIKRSEGGRWAVAVDAGV